MPPPDGLPTTTSLSRDVLADWKLRYAFRDEHFTPDQPVFVEANGVPPSDSQQRCHPALNRPAVSPTRVLYPWYGGSPDNSSTVCHEDGFTRGTPHLVISAQPTITARTTPNPPPFDPFLPTTPFDIGTLNFPFLANSFLCTSAWVRLQQSARRPQPPPMHIPHWLDAIDTATCPRTRNAPSAPPPIPPSVHSLTDNPSRFFGDLALSLSLHPHPSLPYAHKANRPPYAHPTYPPSLSLLALNPPPDHASVAIPTLEDESAGAVHPAWVWWLTLYRRFYTGLADKEMRRMEAVDALGELLGIPPKSGCDRREMRTWREEYWTNMREDAERRAIRGWRSSWEEGRKADGSPPLVELNKAEE